MQGLLPLERLIENLSKLPGVGRKSAERMAYSILNTSKGDITDLINSLTSIKDDIKKCKKCNLITDKDLCDICTSTNRDKSKLIVVSASKDVFSFEQLGSFEGQYFVLDKLLNPTRGVGIEDLNIEQLFKNIKEDEVKEVILALDTTIDGETTSLYIARLLEKFDLEVTRLAYGIPLNGRLDYIDSRTLTRALESRKSIKE